MSTTATPMGFQPVKLLGNRPYNNAPNADFLIASGYNTSIFSGDPVKLVAAGVIEKDTGTNALTPVGIFLGCEYEDPGSLTQTFKPYWPADTTPINGSIRAYVADDPDIIFHLQADGQVPQTALGSNFAIVQTAGSTITGRSKVTLDANTTNTTNTLPVRLVGFLEHPESAINDAFTDCLVKWNVGHAYRNTQGI